MDARAPSPRWSDSWILAALPARHEAAVQRAAEDGIATSAWSALTGAGVPAPEIAAAAAVAAAVPRVTPTQLAGAAPHLLPGHLAERYRAVPIGRERGAVTIAVSDPRAAEAGQLSFVLGCPVRLVLATPDEIDAALARIYRPAASTAAPGSAVPLIERGSAADLDERLIREAVAAGASDVHIEPQTGGTLLVRYRVDGALYDHVRVSAEIAPTLVSRVKVMADLDIADRIRPQDGRSSLRVGGRTVDLRISTLPLDHRGEKVVIRILDAQGTAVGLDGLGFLPAEMHALQQLLEQREGLLLVTGPTGSGKTTTLYSALRHAQSSEANVVTVEDPIEYRLDGISQVQVNEKAGLTFAAALRSILRQDPDVILVGEIRDAETASVSLKASMTGHLVLSTLHTNDAPSAIGRMLDIGVDRAALSAALKGVVAQRLVRRLCPDCSVPVTLAELPVDQQMLLMGRSAQKLRQAVGCAACRGTGYRGRTVVAEVLRMSPEVARTVVRGGSTAEISEAGRGAGMRTLWESGLERVIAGHTSLHELIDNIPAPVVESAGAAQADIDALLASMLAPRAPAPSPAVPASASPPATPPVAVADSGVVPIRQAPSARAQGGLRVLL
ncbi:MAG TPA: GspE/PulE family protein, partial [Longimicrobiaceae bacterium]|nr:GspE/PulE family protein [Longimicrobiaceae bacterium]